MTIEPLIHRCIIHEGDMAGNKTCIVVTAYNASVKCEHCGRALATPEEMLKHIYEQLTA